MKKMNNKHVLICMITNPDGKSVSRLKGIEKTSNLCSFLIAKNRKNYVKISAKSVYTWGNLSDRIIPHFQ